MRVHFIGCEGVSMKTLAKMEIGRGNTVTGSDAKLFGHDPKAVEGADLVVYTSAVGENNVELVRARELKIPTVERAFLLGQLAASYSSVIAVAGTHGKTTTTAMLGAATVRLDPTIHVGGDAALGGSAVGGREIFVTEACEYKRHFLQLKPTLTVVLDVELDHTDYYRDLADMVSAFDELCKKSRLSLVNADDPYCASLGGEKLTFGIDRRADFRAENLSCERGRYSFDFVAYGKNKGRIELSVVGRHNVYDALAAASAATLCGADFYDVKAALSAFKGASRRFEEVGTVAGTAVYTDYAHHPGEIAATIKAARDSGYKFVTAVFEPHTYSRTASLLSEFAEALSLADKTVILPVYPAREPFSESGAAVNLFFSLKTRGAKTAYFDTYCAALDYLASNLSGNGEIILFLGAGDIHIAAHKFVADVANK